jgi:hypothetical protein
MDEVREEDRKPYRKPEIDEVKIDLGVYGDYGVDVPPGGWSNHE